MKEVDINEACESLGIIEIESILNAYIHEDLYYVKYVDGMYHCVLGNEEKFNKDEKVILQFINENAEYWR